MSWLFGKKKTPEFRLLDKTTPSGGLVFWVDDIAKVCNEQGQINGNFVMRMITEAKEMPFYWQVAIATSTPGSALKVKGFPLPEGGCEVHVDHPAIKVSESGEISIS